MACFGLMFGGIKSGGSGGRGSLVKQGGEVGGRQTPQGYVCVGVFLSSEWGCSINQHNRRSENDGSLFGSGIGLKSDTPLRDA